MMGAQAAFARGTSTQAVGTPRNFLDAVERRFGPLDFDLAATADNAVAPRYFTPLIDAFKYNWGGTIPSSPIQPLRLWLNPEFGNIAPWAAKCAAEIRYDPTMKGGPPRRLFLLTPASVGANWWQDHVFGKARVLLLRGRLTFVGHTQPYPKDLTLSIYGEKPGVECWDWRR